MSVNGVGQSLDSEHERAIAAYLERSEGQRVLTGIAGTVIPSLTVNGWRGSERGRSRSRSSGGSSTR